MITPWCRASGSGALSLLAPPTERRFLPSVSDTNSLCDTSSLPGALYFSHPDPADNAALVPAVLHPAELTLFRI